MNDGKDGFSILCCPQHSNLDDVFISVMHVDIFAEKPCVDLGQLKVKRDVKKKVLHIVYLGVCTSHNFSQLLNISLRFFTYISGIFILNCPTANHSFSFPKRSTKETPTFNQARCSVSCGLPCGQVLRPGRCRSALGIHR